MAKRDRRLAVEPEHRLRRLAIGAHDGGDVGQPEETVIDAKIDAAQRLFGCVRAAHPKAHALRAGLHGSGRRNRVLRLEALNHRIPIETEPRDLLGRHVEVDDLVLGSDQIDLSGGRDLQDVGAGLFGVVAQLAKRQTVGREGVDDSIDFAELIVEEWSLYAGGKLRLYIGNLVANLNPDRTNGSAAHALAQVDEDRGLARASCNCW